MIAARNIFLVLVLVWMTAGCKDYSGFDKRLASDLGKELMGKIACRRAGSDQDNCLEC